jgi:Zn-dependent protease with chaperone function
MHSARIVLLLVVAYAAVGCAQQERRSPSRCWVACNGGRSADVSLAARVERVCACLRPSRHVKTYVLASPQPAAYSWRNGDLFVTEGLLQLLDDDELAAALAHEIGHLQRPVRTAEVVGLQGKEDGLRVEVDADRIGVRLLRRIGIAPATMAAMLDKVKEAAILDENYRNDLSVRIERLRRLSGKAG